jgi:hypothetical protein
MTRSQEIESSARCRAHAERLRKFAETVTTPGLRKTLLDAAADFDKLARQSESNIGNVTFPSASASSRPPPA